MLQVVDVDNVDNVDDTGLSLKTDCAMVVSIIAPEYSKSLADFDVDASVDVDVADICNESNAF